LINGTDLFNALIDWVENGVAPASITAYTAEATLASGAALKTYQA
jgi:predicted aconitase with swiveling domain